MSTDFRKKFSIAMIDEIDFNIEFAAENMNMNVKHLYSEWEIEFIADIRSLIEREYRLSTKQYNTLKELAEKHHFK